MLNSLLRFAFRITSVEPEYSENRCLSAGKSADVCSACRDACPHSAITITKRVEIDDIDCSGCGLCIQACPSQALAASASHQPGRALRCSQVKGSGQSVHCLGRLQPSDLLTLAGGSEQVRLIRNDCASCKVGTPAVLDALAETGADAAAIAALHGRKLELDIVETDSFEDRSAENRELSRRQLLTGGWNSVRQGAADLLAPLDPGDAADNSLPAELQHRFELISSAAPAGEQPVPWVLPRVAESCIMCPVCTNVCPTDAFEREFASDGSSVLQLAPDRCTGCGICVTACPVGVITLDSAVSWAELSGGVTTVHERDTDGVASQSIAR
jgi:ferredoxin